MSNVKARMCLDITAINRRERVQQMGLQLQTACTRSPEALDRVLRVSNRTGVRNQLQDLMQTALSLCSLGSVHYRSLLDDTTQQHNTGRCSHTRPVTHKPSRSSERKAAGLGCSMLACCTFCSVIRFSFCIITRSHPSPPRHLGPTQAAITTAHKPTSLSKSEAGCVSEPLFDRRV